MYFPDKASERNSPVQTFAKDCDSCGAQNARVQGESDGALDGTSGKVRGHSLLFAEVLEGMMPKFLEKIRLRWPLRSVLAAAGWVVSMSVAWHPV